MSQKPERNEASEYFFRYIDRVTTDDIVLFLKNQLTDTALFLQKVSEEKSVSRYAPEKWSLREVLNHVSDTERVFLFRALWFARGFPSALPSFEPETAVLSSSAQQVSWASHCEEFMAVRGATNYFFRNMPAAGWLRVGVASGSNFSVRAIAYIIAGHLSHHTEILRERYLS